MVHAQEEREVRQVDRRLHGAVETLAAATSTAFRFHTARLVLDLAGAILPVVGSGSAEAKSHSPARIACEPDEPGPVHRPSDLFSLHALSGERFGQEALLENAVR
jgi:hypothetical protein